MLNQNSSYSLPSIPTKYRGTQYRSRLEARWAAFFDELGWSFVYEPFDLKGWIPDFVIQGTEAILVEVKPVLTLPKDIANEIDRATFNTHFESREALILGVGLLQADFFGAKTIGWVGEVDHNPEKNDDSRWWDSAVLGIWNDKNPDGRIGFCHSSGQYRDRITGGYDGGSCGSRNDPAIMQALWGEASNKVQWNSPL